MVRPTNVDISVNTDGDTSTVNDDVDNKSDSIAAKYRETLQ